MAGSLQAYLRSALETHARDDPVLELDTQYGGDGVGLKVHHPAKAGRPALVWFAIEPSGNAGRSVVFVGPERHVRVIRAAPWGQEDVPELAERAADLLHWWLASVTGEMEG